MTSIRGIHFAPLALLFAIAVSCPHPSQAFDDELSGSHLEPLVPENLDGYTLDEVDVKENSPTLRAVYQSESEDGSIRFTLSYGEDAAERYRRMRGSLSLAAADGEIDTGEVSVQGRTVATARKRSELIAMTYFNHFLVGFTAREARVLEAPGGEKVDTTKGLMDPEATLVDFLEKVDLDRLAEWSPPDEVEYTLGNVPDCVEMECFREHFSRCETAQLTGTLGRRITATYTIEEQLADDQCQMSLVFTDNPNPEWENTPLYFTMNPADGFSMDDVKGVIDDCVEGEGENYNCSGPLLDQMEDE